MSSSMNVRLMATDDVVCLDGACIVAVATLSWPDDCCAVEELLGL